MVRYLPFAILLGCLAGTADAAALRASTLNYQASTVPTGEFHSLGTLQFEGRWRTGFLLNEPVVNCTARWINTEGLSLTMADGTSAQVEAGEAEVYGLLLMARMYRADAARTGIREAIVAFCDAGVVAQNGRDGFNVAGSPNWDRFLCKHRRKAHMATTLLAATQVDDVCAALGGQWMSAAAAREVAATGINFSEVQVLKVDINASETIRRVEKLKWRRTSMARKHQKAQTLAQRIQSKLGLDVDAERMVGRIGTYREAPTADQLDEAERLLAKLQALLADDGALAKTWREDDKKLVAGQLERIRGVDQRLREADQHLAEYRQQLEHAAQSAPIEVDPLARFRSERRLGDRIEYAENGNQCHLRADRGAVNGPYYCCLWVDFDGDDEPLIDVFMVWPSATQQRMHLVSSSGQRLSPDFVGAYLDNWGSDAPWVRVMTTQAAGEYFETSQGHLILTSLRGHSISAVTVYSLLEQRVILNQHQNHPVEGWHPDVNVVSVAGVPNLIGYSSQRKCTVSRDGQTLKGKSSVWRFDLNAQKMLPASESICVTPDMVPS